MEKLNFKEFLSHLVYGLIALSIAALLYGFALGITALTTGERWDYIDKENVARLNAWQAVAAQAMEKHNRLLLQYIALETGSTEGLELTYGEAKYLDLLIALSSETSPDDRVNAYLRFHGYDYMPESETYGTWIALTFNHATPLERKAMLVRNRALPVEGEWMERANQAYEAYEANQPPTPPELPPLPELESYYKISWGVWQILAGAGYGLVLLIMALTYHLDEDNYGRVWRWKLPVNPGSWLVALPFAPAFVVPVVGYGAYALILRPLGIVGWTGLCAVKWVLIDFDVTAPYRKWQEHRTARREARRRREVEAQVRLAEEASIGQDAAHARLQLNELAARIELESDPARRQELAARITQARQDLESVEVLRRERVAVNQLAPKQGDELSQRIDELSTRLEAMNEAERAAGPPPQV